MTKQLNRLLCSMDTISFQLNELSFKVNSVNGFLDDQQQTLDELADKVRKISSDRAD